MTGGALIWLLENALVVTIAGAIAWLCCRHPRVRPAVCHAIWLVILIKLVTPPLISWSWLFGSVPGGDAATPVVESAPLAVGAPGIFPDTPGAGVPDSNPLTAWLLVWALGASILLWVWLSRGAQFNALAQRAAPDWLEAEVGSLSRAMRLRPPGVLVVDKLVAPCVGGLFRPVIYWPAKLVTNPLPASLRAVLAHELAHLKRRDPLTARFEIGAALVWWWHPLFWFVRERVREFAEQACDKWALDVCSVPARQFADTLLALNTCKPGPSTTLAVTSGSKRVFRRRLIRLMAGGAPAKLPRLALLACCAGTLILTPTWTYDDPPLQAALQSWFGADGSESDLDDRIADSKRLLDASTDPRQLGRAGVAQLCDVVEHADADAIAAALGLIANLGPDAAPAYPRLLAQLPKARRELQLPILAALCATAPFQRTDQREDTLTAITQVRSHRPSTTVEIELERLWIRINLSQPAPIDTWIDRLADPRLVVRQAAAFAIGQSTIGAERAAPALAEMLSRATSTQTMRLAATALIRIADDDPLAAVGWSVIAQHDDDFTRRRDAVAAIREYPPHPAVIVRLTEALKTDIPADSTAESFRIELVDALGAMGKAASTALPVIEGFCESDDPELAERARAARSAIK